MNTEKTGSKPQPVQFEDETFAAYGVGLDWIDDDTASVYIHTEHDEIRIGALEDVNADAQSGLNSEFHSPSIVWRPRYCSRVPHDARPARNGMSEEGAGCITERLTVTVEEFVGKLSRLLPRVEEHPYAYSMHDPDESRRPVAHQSTSRRRESGGCGCGR